MHTVFAHCVLSSGVANFENWDLNNLYSAFFAFYLVRPSSMIIVGQYPTKVVLSKCPLNSHSPVFYLSNPADTLLVAINAQGDFHLGENCLKN